MLSPGEKTCIECQKTFQVSGRGGANAIRCTECRKSYLKQYGRENRRFRKEVKERDIKKAHTRDYMGQDRGDEYL